jgi:hypothetical protein
VLLLSIAVRAFMIIPPTGGTGVDASSAAAAPKRADHEHECDADEDVDELIV